MKDVPYQEMFADTQAGMKFYGELFGKPYQYSKYDQIFVPEFNSGAMENNACVTFNEDKLYRGETITLKKRSKLANTNLHELAHHWFGNLVTMKWWDDLWLNESFATYISYLAMDRVPELQKYKGSWIDFSSRKFSGIDSDLTNQTHPIKSQISNTNESETVFDGISYGKGAAFLKQAHNVLGYDTFKEGLTNYF